MQYLKIIYPLLLSILLIVTAVGAVELNIDSEQNTSILTDKYFMFVINTKSGDNIFAYDKNTGEIVWKQKLTVLDGINAVFTRTYRLYKTEALFLNVMVKFLLLMLKVGN